MNASHRPLLVKHQEKSYLVCDIRINNEQRLEVGPLPLTPALTWIDYRPLAVSPGDTCIMGVVNPPAEADGMVVVRNMGSPPIMLPVGEDTIIRMDTVIYGDSSRFEMLRRLFPNAEAVDGGCWFTVPLLRPPLKTLAVPSQSVSILSYFVMGMHVWISVTGEDTFSLDVQLGTWRMEFPEELHRLEGRVFFAPELGAIVGLTGGDKLLCSYKFEHGNDGSRTLTRHNTWREAIPWECFDRGYARRSSMVGLAYVGNDKFWLRRPVQKLGTHIHEFNEYFFLVLELRRHLADGKELGLAKRGEVNYQGVFYGDFTRDLHFIR